MPARDQPRARQRAPRSPARRGRSPSVAAVRRRPHPSARAAIDAAEDRRHLGKRIRLSETSATPVYLQLADQLKYLIATGELVAGSRLPSARHLADNVSINRNTVLNAYAILGR